MIDKNGKLFGKINIIDLLILLAVLAAVVLAALRRLDTRDLLPSAPETRKVRVTFFGKEVSEFLPDSLTVGDPVSEYGSEISLGTLTDFSYEPAYTWAYDSEQGEAVRVPTVNYCFLTFTCEAEGVLDETGFSVEDVTFVVGGNHYINIGPARTACQVMRLEPLG